MLATLSLVMVSIGQGQCQPLPGLLDRDVAAEALHHAALGGADLVVAAREPHRDASSSSASAAVPPPLPGRHSRCTRCCQRRSISSSDESSGAPRGAGRFLSSPG